MNTIVLKQYQEVFRHQKEVMHNVLQDAEETLKIFKGNSHERLFAEAYCCYLSMRASLDSYDAIIQIFLQDNINKDDASLVGKINDAMSQDAQFCQDHQHFLSYEASLEKDSVKEKRQKEEITKENRPMDTLSLFSKDSHIKLARSLSDTQGCIKSLSTFFSL